MIVDKIFEWFAAAIRWILSGLPEWSLPDLSVDVNQFFDRIQPHGALVAWINLYVPLGEALVLLTLGLAFWVAAHVVNFASWAISKLHVAGGSA